LKLSIYRNVENLMFLYIESSNHEILPRF